MQYSIVNGSHNRVAHLLHGVNFDGVMPLSSRCGLFLRGWYNPYEYTTDRPAWMMHGGIDFPATMSAAVAVASHLLRYDWHQYHTGVYRRKLLYVDICRSIGGGGVAYSVVCCAIPNTLPLDGGIRFVSEDDAYRFFDDELVPTVYGGLSWM